MPDAMTQVSRFGPRVSTILIYLNDDYGGGETEFPTIGWRYKGRPGDLLFFWNVTEAGEPDLLTLHAGLTPTYGEKWLLSQWVRGRVG
jgi:prolyl 4-hydroxylase